MRSKALIPVVVLALVALSFARQDKLAPELRTATKGNVNVIIRYKVVPGARHLQMLNRHQGQVTKDLSSMKFLAAAMPASRVDGLSNDPDVAYITPDRPLSGMGTGSPTAVLDYHTDTVNAPVAWARGLNGTGIGVAVIDSGIIDIPDLHGQNGSRVIFSQNFVGGTTGSANDQYGHGSHVAGIIGGNGNKSTGSHYTYTFEGIAPNVNLINLRVLDQNGEGTDSQVIAAIQMAIQLKSTYNIRVINLSLGRPVVESYTVDPLCQAVEAAYQAGIVVVVAAGNDGRDNSNGTNGYGTITAPANDPYVITVGAMKTMGTPSRADDEIATYSSKGPTAIDHIVKPDLVAPGNRIISLYTAGETLKQLYPGNEIPKSLYETNNGAAASGTYYVLSGTSMAAPMVSGTAALLLQQNPNLTPDQIKAELMLTASKTFPPYSTYTDPTTGITYTDQYDLFTVGAGYLDIQAALANTQTFNGVATSPMVAYDSTTQSVYFVNNSFAIWGGSSNWSSFAIWGGSAFVSSNFAIWGGSSPYASFAIWGGSAPWGSGTNDGFFAIWGGSTVASSSIDGGESTTLLIHGEN